MEFWGSSDNRPHAGFIHIRKGEGGVDDGLERRCPKPVIAIVTIITRGCSLPPLIENGTERSLLSPGMGCGHRCSLTQIQSAHSFVHPENSSQVPRHREPGLNRMERSCREAAS